jgi:integrase
LVLRGYADARAKAKITGPRRAVPAALWAMLVTLERTTPIGAQDAAILLLGFANAARRSELAALDIADLHESEEGLKVNLYRAKVRTPTPSPCPTAPTPPRVPCGPCAPDAP